MQSLTKGGAVLGVILSLIIGFALWHFADLWRDPVGLFLMIVLLGVLAICMLSKSRRDRDREDLGAAAFFAVFSLIILGGLSHVLIFA